MKIKAMVGLGVSLLLLCGNMAVSAPYNGVLSSGREDYRPSYSYLRSVTVIVKGEGYIREYKEDEEGEKIQISEKLTEWIGTGVIISMRGGDCEVLTNAHVAERGKDKLEDIKITVEGELKQEFGAEIIKIHSTVDLALLKVKGVFYKKTAIKGVGKSTYQDRLYVVRHHLGRKYLYGEGVFAGYDGKSIIIQVPCAFGNSGSGVFNVNGELIGMVYAINSVGFFSYDVAHAVCVSSRDIELFLIENKIGY